MRIIKAKFRSICSHTGKVIHKGDLCLYSPDQRKAFHISAEVEDDTAKFIQAEQDAYFDRFCQANNI